jgi:hypothetical protein
VLIDYTFKALGVNANSQSITTQCNVLLQLHADLLRDAESNH